MQRPINISDVIARVVKLNRSAQAACKQTGDDHTGGAGGEEAADLGAMRVEPLIRRKSTSWAYVVAPTN
jgi:hypothetical protein